MFPCCALFNSSLTSDERFKPTCTVGRPLVSSHSTSRAIWVERPEPSAPSIAISRPGKILGVYTRNAVAVKTAAGLFVRRIFHAAASSKGSVIFSVRTDCRRQRQTGFAA